MRPVGLVVVVLVLAASNGTAAAAPGGIPRQLVGTWSRPGGVVTVKANGHAVFKLGQEVIQETASGTSARVTFDPTGLCAGKGTYSWKLAGRRLTLRPISDACGLRRSFLQAAWTRK